MSLLRDCYEVIKKVSYVSETLSGNIKQSYGVLRIDKIRKSVNFVSFRDPAPKVQDFLYFILSDKTIRDMIRDYQKTERVLNYKISARGQSATHIFINFYHYGIYSHRKKLISWSSQSKVYDIHNLYIGDLVEMVVFFNESQPSYLPSIENFSRKWLRSRTTFKYVKCEYEEGTTNYVSSII